MLIVYSILYTVTVYSPPPAPVYTRVCDSVMVEMCPCPPYSLSHPPPNTHYHTYACLLLTLFTSGQSTTHTVVSQLPTLWLVNYPHCG